MAMLVYSAITSLDGQPQVMTDYAHLWRAADKIVYSTTLESAPTGRTRIERTFDPLAVRQLKANSARDITVGGPSLAADAIAAGLVDEYRMFLNPIVVGDGTRALPDRVRIELELLEERRFRNGVVYLRYRTRS